MEKIIITCDTTCAIYGKEREELGIYVLPLNVIVDGKEYHDGIDIDQKTLCTMMRNKAKISTSTPTPVEIEQFFDEVIEKTNPTKIIHFTISSKLSSMFSLFTTVCAEKYKDRVTIVDSLSVCSFMGNIVKTAVKAKNEGKTVEEIIAKTQERMGTDIIFFFPESLEFLKRGGRITPAVALIAGLIGVKPVLKFTTNGVEKEGVTRTTQKAYMTALKQYSEVPNLDEYELHILECDSMDTCKKVEKEAHEILPQLKVLITPLSINVMAHTGPGTVGVGLTKKIS